MVRNPNAAYACPVPEPGRRPTRAMWIAAAILIGAILVSLTIWMTRPEADPQSSRAACEAAGGEWWGDFNRLVEATDVVTGKDDCVFDEQ